MKIKDGVFYKNNDALILRANKIDFKDESYKMWKSMIYRVYYPSQLERRPEYSNCTVSQDWFIFENFKTWHDSVEYGKSLDKDLKTLGSNEYSSENCLLMNQVTNSFLIGLFKQKSNFMTGVQKYENRGQKCWKSQINLGKGTVSIGWFYSELDAHLAWQKLKIKRLQEIAHLEKVLKWCII